MSHVRTVLVSLTGALALLGTACGSTASASGTQPAGRFELSAATLHRVQADPTSWMLSVGALERLETAGLPRPLLQAFFDRPSTIVIGSARGRPDPLVPRATSAADFTSAGALIAALRAGRVPAGVPDLVLDIEDWPLTPVSEQRAPIAAANQALAAARAAHKRLIFTPAVNLVHVLVGTPVQGSTLEADYDRLVAGPGAGASDLFEIQAQSTEGTPDATSFAAGAIAAVHVAHAGEPALVGLSTNPSGRAVTPGDLLALVQASEPGAAGFWLNIPQAGKACPKCGVAQPQVAVAFLESLAGEPPAAGSQVQRTAPGVRGSSSSSSSTSSTASSPPLPSSPSPLLGSTGELLAAGGHPARWLFAASQFADVVNIPAVERLMGAGPTYEPVSARQAPSTLVPVVPTLVVHSEAALAQMVDEGTVPPDIRAVLYDNERFPDTPADEQANPGAYDALVARLATAHGWTSICDLIESDRLATDRRTPADEVPPCDVIGLNTVQQSERDPSAYASKVADDVAIIGAVAPGRPVLAGLSSNPAGGAVTAGQLAGDIDATHSQVAGYWLDVPSPGVGCPHCAAPDPRLMVSALEQVAG